MDANDVMREFLSDLTALTAPDFCGDDHVATARARRPYGITVGCIAGANEAFIALTDQLAAERTAREAAEAKLARVLALLARIRDDRSWRTNDNNLWPDILSALEPAAVEGRG